MSRSLFSPTPLTAPWLSCASLRLCLLDGNIHKENNLVLCVVMEQSRVEQRWQGEIANCVLLRDNIVMLDYPSACWHRPASPWTHNPAEKQPTANGGFLRRGCFLHIQCSEISHLLVPVIELIYQVCLPVCFTVICLPCHCAHWLLLSFFIFCYDLVPYTEK